jgi:hypothetical protein
LAAAVPDVQVTTTGLPLAFARPTATYPAERSSMTEIDSMRDSAASVRSNGALREPGHVTACFSPQRASSSTKACSGA